MHFFSHGKWGILLILELICVACCQYCIFFVLSHIVIKSKSLFHVQKDNAGHKLGKKS